MRPSTEFLSSLAEGDRLLIDRLRQCMQSKPASFAQGVASIVTLVGQEVVQ